MGISEIERLRANYDRLLSLASEVRERGQTHFAELLVDRASKYLDQIAVLEKQSNDLNRARQHKRSQFENPAKNE
jgi:hypothetical protein